MAIHESVERREGRTGGLSAATPGLARKTPPEPRGGNLLSILSHSLCSRVISIRVRRLHYQSSPACCKYFPEPAIPDTFRLLHCCEHVYKTAFLRLTFCGMSITLYKKQKSGGLKALLLSLSAGSWMHE